MLNHAVSNNNEIKITYLLFITHQSVKIWWCTFTERNNKNDRNSTSPYKLKEFMVSSPLFEQ